MSAEAKNRAEGLRGMLYDPGEKLNIDMMMDCVIALYTDLNSPAIKSNKNVKAFLDRYELMINKLQNARPRISDYQKIKVIGRGAFGEVRLVRHKFTKKVYAMKTLSKTDIMKRGTESAFFWEERDIMAKSKSNWIVPLFHAFQDRKHLYMVMEFMPGGDMVYLMGQFDIHDNWARFYTAEVVLAVNAIHEMGFIHRDVKPDNMLLDRTGHLKLADFGTCMKMDQHGKVKSDKAVGTPDYISPEVLTSQGNGATYGRECDWWSVGVFLYEMLNNDTPFYSEGLVGTYGKILDFRNTLKFEQKIDKNAEDLIRKFLTDASERLGRKGIPDICRHPFFKTEEWTWDNIRQCVAPYTVELKSDADTTNFDDIEENPNEVDSFPTPRTYAGNHLPFVGFTFSHSPDWVESNKPAEEKQKRPSNSVPPPLAGRTSVSGYNDDPTTAKWQKQVKTLEERLRNYERDSKKTSSLQEVLEQEKRARADSETRTNRLEQEKRKLELRSNEAVRNNEEFNKKMISYDSEISQLKAKLSEESQFRRRNQEQIKILTRELGDKEEKLQSALDNQAAHRKELQQHKFAKSDLENQLRDANSKVKLTQSDLIKTKEELTTLQERFSNAKSNKDVEYAQLEMENKRLNENYNTLKDESEREAKRLRLDLDTITRSIQDTERLTQSQTQRQKELQIELKAARDTTVSAKMIQERVDTEASRRRMSLEEELQQMKEQSRILEDKVAKAEFDCKLKEDTVQRLDGEIRSLMEKQRDRETKMDTISRDNHLFKSKLDQMHQEQEVKVRSETRLKQEYYEEEKRSITEKLEQSNNKVLNLTRQLEELHDQHETSVYFQNLYKSQVRENKDEIEDERAKNENLESRIVQLEQEKARLHRDQIKKLDEKQKWYDDEIDRLHNEKETVRQQHQEDINELLLNKKTLEDAIFNANDSYDEIDAENKNFRKELHDIHIGWQQEKEHWQESKMNLEQKLMTEIILKKQSVNKLVQVMTSKKNPMNDDKDGRGQSRKMLKDDLKKLDRRQKELEVTINEQKREANVMLRNKDVEIEELKDVITQETSLIQEKDMELQSKSMELDSLKKQLLEFQHSTSHIPSSVHDMSLSVHTDSGPREGWLEIPSAKGIGQRHDRGGWVKTYVALSEKKLFFYAGQSEHKTHQPKMIIDLDKLFHVRKVTPADAFRAKQNDIPRMFQIIYGNEGMTSRDHAQPGLDANRGHQFFPITYRSPTYCDMEGCHKSLWNMLNPPPALTCQKCNLKYHKSHVESNERQKIPPCRHNFDMTMAKDLLVLAPDSNAQIDWIRVLSKKVPLQPPARPDNFDRGSPINFSLKQRLKR